MNSRGRSAALAISCFALAVGGTVCVDLASSHPGFDPATEKLSQRIQQEPDRIDLLIKRGQLYRSNGKYIESLHDFDRASQLDPNNLEIVFERALALSALGRDVEAEIELDRFLEREFHRSMVVALAERAYIRARTGREGLAITDLTTVIHINPSVGVYLARGKIQESVGDLESAARGYRKGLLQMGNAILLKKQLIRVETARERYGEALALIDEELDQTSVKSPWYLHRAEILALMGQAQAAQLAHEQALAETTHVLGERPTALHRVSRAKVYMAMGRLDDARRDLQLAVQMAPHFGEAEELLRTVEGR